MANGRLARLGPVRLAFLYFSLAFVISWGDILLAVGPEGLRKSFESQGTLAVGPGPEFALVFLAMLAGPRVASVALTGVTEASIAAVFRLDVEVRGQTLFCGWQVPSPNCTSPAEWRLGETPFLRDLNLSIKQVAAIV